MSASRLHYPGGVSPPLDGKTPVFEEVGADPTIAPGLDRPPSSTAKFGTDYYWKFGLGATDWIVNPFNTGGGGGGDVVADWAIGATRFYAVDATNGDDGNAGFSDASAAAAYAVAKQTWAGLLAILPRIGAGRDVTILVAGDFTGEDLRLCGVVGYGDLVLAATTDGSDDAADRRLCGFVQSAAGPGAGGAWTVTAGATTSEFTIAAGALPAEPAQLLHRLRFTSGALSGQVYPIQRNTGTVITTSVDMAGAPADGVTFQIEAPGVLFDRVFLGDISCENVEVRGIKSLGIWTEYNVSAALNERIGCEAVGNVTISNAPVLGMSQAASIGAATVGMGFRGARLSLNNIGRLSGDSSGYTANASTWQVVLFSSWGAGCLIRNAALFLVSCGKSGGGLGGSGFAVGRGVAGFRDMRAQAAAIAVNGSVVCLQNLVVENTANPIVVLGVDNRVLLFAVTGATGNTGAGCKLSLCSRSEIYAHSDVTVAGDDEILLPGGSLEPSGIPALWADLAKTNVVAQGALVASGFGSADSGPVYVDGVAGRVVAACALALNNNGANPIDGPGFLCFYDGAEEYSVSLSDRATAAGARCDGVSVHQVPAGAAMYIALPGGLVFVNAESGAAGDLAYVGADAGAADAAVVEAGDFRLRVGYFQKDTNVSNENYLAFRPELICAPGNGEP